MGASFLVADDSNAPSTSAPRLPPGTCQAVLGHPATTQRVKNVFRLLAHRELCPRAKRSSKRFWRSSYVRQPDSNGPRSKGIGDARCGLISWAEAESVQHMAATDCPLFPPPRSTIAAAFSPDGRTLASTHGDHTVKIIDYTTGGSLKVLSGHRRTPWVVRFHPLYPEILASGSLDNEVRLWDANTGHCIGSYDFYRPIASIAFHAQGELLAVASGHKLYIWHYNRQGDTPLPTIVLKTRRSLRAVLFHPHAAPFLLTAEVNELDSSESEMTMATSPGYLRYPPPTVYLANSHNRDVGPSSALHSGVPSASVRLLTYSTPSRQYELLLSPAEPNDSLLVPEDTQTNPNFSETETANDSLNNMEGEPEEGSNQFFSFGDSWELPFLQGWLVGQTQATQRTLSRDNGAARGNSSAAPSHSVNLSRVNQRTGSSAVASVNSIVHDTNPHSIDSSRIQSELATSQAAAAASAELPCTVKLRIWSYTAKNPYAVLSSGRCRLTIPHTVLCSEMGTHFSPCGRFLAACVACTLHHWEADHSSVNHNVTGEPTSPTRHPVFAHQVIYELRIYSVEEATFGKVLASQAIRAAHCLTSVQFSPTSEHLLLAYGRRHYSLLKSVAIDGERTVPTYTILEVYRVSDLELVRVLSSKEDEVNVACFHPLVGGGLVYGTKEGKLRILAYDGPPAADDITCDLPDENMLQIPMNGPEC